MKKATIFTGLVEINENLVGTAVIYKKIAELLVQKGYETHLVVPEKTDIKSQKLNFHLYNNTQNKKLINQSSLVIFGAYLPIEPLIYAYRKKKTIVTYLWSIAPIGSLEFKDFKNKLKQNRLHQYITASYNLSLLLSDKIFCRDEQIKKFILGSLTNLGRVNLKNYEKSKQLKNLVEAAPFGIETLTPKHKKDIYRTKYKNINKNDFLLIWNGGIWNWNDGQTLIKAMDLLKNKNIKLIFQGFKHPSEYQKLSLEAQKTISLAKKLKLMNKNVFFIEKWVPFEQRGNFLTECNAGIVTSPDILEANLFLKTRIYDYLWAELPILLNDSEAFAKIIEKNNLGIVAKTKNPRDLANKILKLYTNKKLQEQIKNNIKKYKQQISWQKTLKPVKNYLAKPVKLNDKYQKDDKVLQNSIKSIIDFLKKTKI